MQWVTDPITVEGSYAFPLLEDGEFGQAIRPWKAVKDENVPCGSWMLLKPDGINAMYWTRKIKRGIGHTLEFTLSPPKELMIRAMLLGIPIRKLNG